MIGVDEVGRGAWAGVFMVAAVRLHADFKHLNLNDSKQLTPHKRQSIATQLAINSLVEVGYASIEALLIDKYGLSWAQTEAMAQAVNQLSPQSQEVIIIDGSVDYLAHIFSNTKAVIRADSYYQEVMIASILAKVKRDALMIELAQRYPRYGFDQHKGYGTVAHRQAIDKFGAIKGIHRFSYKSISLK